MEHGGGDQELRRRRVSGQYMNRGRYKEAELLSDAFLNISFSPA